MERKDDHDMAHEDIILSVIEPTAPSIDLSLTKSPELVNTPWSTAGEHAAGEIALEAINAYIMFDTSQVALLANANAWALNLVWIPIIVGGITGMAALVGGGTAVLVGLVTSSIGNTINAMAAGYTRSKDFHGRQGRYSTYAKECKNFASQIKIMLSAYPRENRPPFTNCMTEWMKRWGELTTNQPEFAKECAKNSCSKKLATVGDYITFYKIDKTRHSESNENSF